MALLRPIREAPKTPTGPELRALLKEYGLTRWRACHIVEVAAVTFDRYCLTETSRHHKDIPKLRWRILRAALDDIDKEMAT